MALLSVKRIFAAIPSDLKFANYILSVILVVLIANQAIACAVDITIDQGDTIEMCSEPLLPISGAPGYTNYQWTGPESFSGISFIPQTSGQYVLSAEDGAGCISADTIEVIINLNPTPIITSSEGNPICSSSGGTLLSLSTSYASYDWDGGNVGPTLFASGAGNYSVTVMDDNGCVGTNNIAITEIQFDLTVTTVGGCQGSTVLLQASGGGTYAWSTGETGQAIVVGPTTTTTYNVDITNGTCAETLSATVPGITPLEYDLVDTLYMGVGDQEVVTGPPGYESYSWTPTDQIGFPNTISATVTASNSHILYLEAVHPTGCIFEDSVVIIVVDLTIPNGFSPNDDGVNDIYIIPQLYEFNGSIIIWNRWGDIVFESDKYENNWDGTCRGPLCVGNGRLPEGTYFYLVKVEDIESKGFITLNR